nr:MAG TPA: hypothetical protein [Caudoviricetes sp.]
MAQIFRKGDKVFDPLVGWGTVYNVVSYTEYPIVVVFENGNTSYNYTKDGKRLLEHKLPILSFVEYDFINGGYSTTKKYNYSEYIGKWGKFTNEGTSNIVINKLKEYNESETLPFVSAEDIKYKNFIPLSESEIEILGL